MTSPTFRYIRNPITGEVREVSPTLATKLRSYGWEYVKAVDYRMWRVVSALRRSELNHA